MFRLPQENTSLPPKSPLGHPAISRGVRVSQGQQKNLKLSFGQSVARSLAVPSDREAMQFQIDFSTPRKASYKCFDADSQPASQPARQTDRQTDRRADSRAARSNSTNNNDPPVVEVGPEKFHRCGCPRRAALAGTSFQGRLADQLTN